MRGDFVKRLGALHVRGRRAFLALSYLERYGVADLELVIGHAVQILGVEEKVLRLAFARDKTESAIRKGLDCSCHSFVKLCY